MTIPFIDLKSQYRAIEQDVDQRIKAVLEHGSFIMGPEVAEMETALADWTGAGHCISVSSGTEALLICLMALGIGPGDEVITTPFTFIATAEVIALTGATPVFVDVEPDTANIDVSKIAERITDRTRAIMPVSLYGQVADMTAMNALAEKHGLTVIEDAAQSFGAAYGNKRSCNLSTFGCTSFFPSKPLGCYGDGGAIFTSDADLAEACRQIRVHGQSARYVHTRIGLGGRMDTLQCAVVLAKLARFDWEVERRLALGARYNQLIDAAGIDRIVQRANRTSVFAQYTVKVDNRAEVVRKLGEAGIPTAVHYPVPANRQSAYLHFDPDHQTPVADHLASCVMSLPMSPDLDEAVQDRIVAALIDAVA
jgi:UDP-2-acetamido-2-deoxy-ribo-hexuluronate aminotransferase